MNALKRMALVAMVASTAVAMTFLTAAAADVKPQTKCPVTGEPIDKAIYVDYQGQRIYFCCKMCPAKFKADPEKYFKQFADEGILLKNVETACPVMGGKPRADLFRDYKGRRVLFCCPVCPPKFDKDPEKYLKKLEAQTAEKKDEKTEKHEGHEHHEHNGATKSEGTSSCGR